MTSMARTLAALLFGALIAGCGSAAQPVSGSGSPQATDSSSATALASPGTATSAPTPRATVVGDLTAPVRAGDWPAYGLDAANSLTNRGETTLAPDNVDTLVEAWRIETGGVTATPVVVGGIVYFGDWLGTVRAVDAKTGGVAWEQSVTDAPISASAALTDQLVIVGDLAGGLHALWRSDGSSAWSTTVNTAEASLFASPVVLGDIVVVGMTDSELSTSDDPDFRCAIVAFDLADGSERWRLFTDPDDSPGLWVTVWSSAAHDAERGLIYVGTGNTNQAASLRQDEDSVEGLPLADGVVAIEADTGEIAWFTQVIADDRGRDLDIGGSPNLFSIGTRDVLGVGGKSGDYVVIDRDSGELIWQQHLTAGSPGGGVMQTAAVDDGRIYVASNDNGGNATVFALEAADGSIVWQKALDGSIFGGSMALANGVLYRGLWSGGFLALDAATGEELWRAAGEARFAGGAAIVHGMVYAGYGSGVPSSLSAPTGGLIAWHLRG